jgi:hypothetical protein
MTAGGVIPVHGPDCRTCRNTGVVPTQDYDGSIYDQACPDCERIPSSAGEPDATDTEGAMVQWPEVPF